MQMYANWGRGSCQREHWPIIFGDRRNLCHEQSLNKFVYISQALVLYKNVFSFQFNY